MSDYYIKINDGNPQEYEGLSFKVKTPTSENNQTTEEFHIIDDGEYNSLGTIFYSTIENLRDDVEINEFIDDIVSDENFNLTSAESIESVIDTLNHQLRYDYDDINGFEERISDVDESVQSFEDYFDDELKQELNEKVGSRDYTTYLDENSSKYIPNHTLKGLFNERFSWRTPTHKLYDPFGYYTEDIVDCQFEVLHDFKLAHLSFSHRFTVEPGLKLFPISIGKGFRPTRTIRKICHNSSNNFRVLFILKPDSNWSYVFGSLDNESTVTLSVDFIYKYGVLEG
ncbi:MAG: hypothetical protein J6Y78_11090 [Paludibacteraceae bacterium]|nr:hypothetical protein [Paludibacteraceae bacterium]